MANGRIWVGSFGLRARMGHFKRVENGLGWVRRVGLTHIFHTHKKKKNANFLRENESNQIIRLYVTNLLLYM